MPRVKKDPTERPAVARGLSTKFVDILLDHLGIDEDEITTDATLVEDLGADSLDIIELQLAFEAEYNLPANCLDDEIAEQWSTGTVDDVLRTLKAKGAKV